MKKYLFFLLFCSIYSRSLTAQVIDNSGNFSPVLTGTKIVYVELTFADVNTNLNYDCTFALSKGAIVSYSDYSAAVSLYDEGISFRNSGTFMQDFKVFPVPGQTYKFWFTLNISSSTYSVDYETVGVTTPVRLATNYAFRKSPVTEINKWSCLHNPTGEPDVVTVFSVGEVASVGNDLTNYRSATSGDWNNITTWERSYDNVNWANSTSVPTSASQSVLIRPDHRITVSANVTSPTTTINSGGQLTLSSGSTMGVSGNFSINSDQTGVGTFVDENASSGLTVSGTTNVQQYLTAARNWYIASPVTTGTASNLNLGTSVQSYSESTKAWSVLTGSDILSTGKGYVSVAGVGTGTTGTVSFNGILNSGTLTVPVTRTGTDKAGFNLVANPYPSYLDWSLVTADPLNANIGTTMWFRTKTAGNLYTFSTYNSTGNIAAANNASTSITKLIPPMQAFWIRVNNGIASTTLTFKNTMRVHKDDNGNTIKVPKYDNRQLLRLQVSNGTNSDETVVYFNTNAQNSFDYYDSQKLFNNNVQQPEIYTVAGSEQLVINGMSELTTNTEIPLGFITGTANNFTFTITELKNLNDTKVILRDKQNPTVETELSEGVAYNFSSQISTTPSSERFSLQFRVPEATTGSVRTEKEHVSVFVNAQNQITIIAKPKSNYLIYNAVGQLIENGTLNSDIKTLSSKLTSGVYVVKVNNESTRVVVK